MALCGERYWSLLRTDGGHTPEKPYGTWPFDDPGPIVYSEWRTLAQQLTDRVWTALERLGQIEEELGKGFPEYNRLNDEAARVYNERNKLEHPLLAFSPADWAPRAVQVSKDAVCVLEKIDEAIASYGKLPTTATPRGSAAPKLPGESTFIERWAPVAVIGAVVGLAWYGDKKGWL